MATDAQKCFNNWLNDALISHVNKRFQAGNLDLWKEMKQGGLPDLIKEENDQNLFRFISDRVKKLILSTDIEYVASSSIGKVAILLFMS